MLGKLLKHELKATGRTFLPLYLAIIIVSFLNGLLVVPTSSNDSFGTFSVILIIILVALYTALGVLTLVVTVQRFNKNLLGDEGYLMFTLPVSPKKLVLSKTIVSVIWYLGSIFVAGISFLTIALAALIKLGDNFQATANRILEEIYIILSNISSFQFLSDFINLILLVVLVLGTFTLVIYLSISIGQLPMFNKHRMLMAFVSYFIINTVISTIGNTFLGISPIFHSLPMAYLGVITTGLIAFFCTTFILERKLNLE